MEVDSGFKKIYFLLNNKKCLKWEFYQKEFTIHHAEDIGKYQIVDRLEHANTAHQVVVQHYGQQDERKNMKWLFKEKDCTESDISRIEKSLM